MEGSVSIPMDTDELPNVQVSEGEAALRRCVLPIRSGTGNGQWATGLQAAPANCQWKEQPEFEVSASST